MSTPRIVLKATTPWEKEVAKRIRRGIKLLDSVTPNWFDPINPATLVVSRRAMCVFAQASHSFKQGIVQVAEKALREGKKVKLLENSGLYYWLPRTNRGESKPTIDVFYYGFDVSYQEAFEFGFAQDSWDRREKRGSRKEAFRTIDAMWKSVVVQKKQHAQSAKQNAGEGGGPRSIPSQPRPTLLQPNANFKQVKD